MWITLGLVLAVGLMAVAFGLCLMRSCWRQMEADHGAEEE